MNYSIIISDDLAGQNIKNFLDVPYKEFEGECIGQENVDEKVEGDVLIFPTTHRSEKGVQSLTVHYPGNWGKADLGGRERELCVAPASLAKSLYLELKKRFEGEVSFECTHHGPFLKKPAVFIEIGSSEEEWKKPELGKIVGETINTVLKDVKKFKTVIFLGGGHYPHEVNKVLERTEYAIGHICPKYQLEVLDKELLKQAWERNVEKPEFVVLDWKGLGKEKARVLEMLEELGYEYKKSKDIR